jgi:hypothetical protein
MEYTDAPENFIRASAYYVVSATLGEFYVNRLVPFGAQRPNLWMILSSIPGRMRRSTVQRLAYISYKKIIGADFFPDMIIEEGTPEGIMDAIGQEPKSSYTIQSTEFGSVMERMSKGNYQYGVSALLSKLYYGESGRQSLSRRGGKKKDRLLPPGLYVTLFAGLQEAYHYFTIEMLNQGLLRRLLVIYEEKANRWRPPIDQLRQSFYLDNLTNPLKKERQKLVRKLGTNQKISVILLPDAEDKINSYSKKLDRVLDTEQDNVALYKQTLWEHLLKLSTVSAIPRGGKVIGGRPVLNVTMDDVNKASDFLKGIESGMQIIIENLGEMEEPLRTQKTAERRTYRYIRQAGENGIGMNDLGKKFPGVPRAKVTQFVDNLRSQGKIQIKHIEPKGPGRPPRILIASEYID